MPIANTAILLVIILAIIVAVLNKKSIARHESIESSIADVKAAFVQKCDDITDNISAQSKKTKSDLELLHRDVTELKNESSSAIAKAEKQAEDRAESAYTRAAEYADQKTAGAMHYAEDLHDDLVSQLEERIGALASILDSLNNENAQLREELNDQKRKLNFYANIEEAAENLTIKEDAEERAKALEAVKQQILDRKREPTGEYTGRPDGTNPIEQSRVQGSLKPGPSIPPGDHTQYAPDHQISPEGGLTEEKGLDKEQLFARDYIDDTDENVFITGKAGTGKSFLLDSFRATTQKANIVLAPTGIAALNVKGATLHSVFGYYNLVKLDVDNINDDTIRLKNEKRSVLKRVNTIIIDEISMVRADTFDKIDRILKVINHSTLPFGGKQMLVFGDLFQLPPVTRGMEYDYLYDKYGGVFFFHSNAYKAGKFKFIELTVNHRQKGDIAFFEILNRIREGETTDEDIALLNTRYTPDESIYDRYTALLPTKAEAESVNRSHMNKLESAEYKFKARIALDKNPNKNKSIESVFPITEELRLRLGANVMMVANDSDGRWVNGTLGIIKELSQDKIVVSFGGNRNYEVLPVAFDEQEITYEDGKITYTTVFSVVQYPIVPAYAITIHKSQGQTYNNVMCDIERCFASGQAYVALSRCASLEGLHLKSYVTPASIKVDRQVLDFYRSQQENDLLR